MRIIPFYKPSLGDHEIAEVIDTLRGGWLTTGSKTKRFENDFASYVGRRHAVALNSCTAALHLALEAVGVGAGDVVILPTMTFAATAEVVRYFNAQPLLADCSEADFNIDIDDAERQITLALAVGKKVKAIMPVHFGGQIGDMTGIKSLARRYHLKIIEDAAHCCPAYYRADADAPWLPVGAESDICCFSFYANKTITTGEGGMACTDDPASAERMRIMSLHGISRDAWKRFTTEGSWYYEITAPGFKYNLTDIAASIGIHQLRKANELHARRTQLAELYAQNLGNVTEVILPAAQPNRIHSWHLYVIRLKPDSLAIDRDSVIEELKKAGVGTSVHWLPLHMHPYYRRTYEYQADAMPRAARLYQEIISLPLYPDMTSEDVGYVCDHLKEILAQNLKLHSRKTAPSAATNLITQPVAG